MMWFYAFSENFVSFLECYILCCTYRLFFEQRFSKWKHASACVLGGLVLTLLTSFLNSFSLFSFFAVAVAVTVFPLLALVLYRANWFQMVSVTILYYVLILAYDFLIISIVELLYGVNDFTMTILTEVGPARMAYIWIQKITLVVGYLLLTHRNKGCRIQLTSRVNLALTASGTLCFFFMQYLVNAVLVGDVTEVKKSVLIAWLFILLFFAGVWALAAAYSKMEVQRMERNVAESKAAALEENSMRLNRAYSEIAKVSHDFRNHLRTMGAMADAGQWEELRGYLQMLTEDLSSIGGPVYTGVETVDALLSRMAHEARARRIPFSIGAHRLTDLQICPAGMCAMLAGLLEDALEASAQISDPAKRMIEVHIEPVHARLMIWVKYAAPGYLEMSAAAGNAGPQAQGCGLEQIRPVAERYGGSLETAREGCFFMARILLNFGDNM